LLDIEVIGSEDDFKEHFLVHSDEFLIPLRNVGGPFAGVILALLSICSRQRLAPVVVAVFQNLK
jgi:hypothetical protein